MNDEWKTYLKKIYFDPKHPAAFAGPTKLYQVVKKEGRYTIGLHRIKHWLQDQDAYSLQKQLVRKFKRNKMVVNGIDHLWDTDLADVSNLAQENDGVKFLLIAICVFSRFLWVIPLKDKKHNSIIDGLKEVFAQGRKPILIRADKGSEYKNRWVKTFLRKEAVKIIFTQNETKASYAERVIRTLKNMLYRYFSHIRSYRYIETLQDLVNNYNHQPHRSLKEVSPIYVTQSNESLLWKQMYVDTLKKKKSVKKEVKTEKKKLPKRIPFKFKVGDHVRISHLKYAFQRDFQQKWTEEVFIVNQRIIREGIPLYKLKDYANDPIEGTFYGPELQKVNKTMDEIWRIDKVIKKRKRGGKTELFVSWLGWPKKFNSYILESTLQ